MRAAWNAVEMAWQSSPLAHERHIFEVATSIMHEVNERTSNSLAPPVLIAFACTADDLLELEDIERFELDWPAVESNAALAVKARAMLVRRRRWAADYDRIIGIFRRQLIEGFTTFANELPESCFEAWPDEGDVAFTVPLVSLLEQPALAMDRLITALYNDDTLASEIFVRAREQLVTNMLIASGFPPTTNAYEVQDRLVIPSRQKHTSPSDLAEMYFTGTPLQHLLALPVPFHVPNALRFEHCHVLGGTGHGKTQLMQRMIHADLVAAHEDGRSVIVIDSQGDLIQKLVRLDLFSPSLPNSLADRLVLIDPTDVEHPASLNLFDTHLGRLAEYRPVDRERVLNGVVELYEGFFGALLGAELTQKQGVIFRYLARLMLTMPGATIHTLMQLMEDGHAFKPYMERLDGSARYFFEKEFFHPSFAATKKQILKRLWGVLSTPAFERMFAQQENKLDLFEALNGGKIILVNTAKDLLKTEGSQLFGRFFISMLSQAALERSTVPEARRTPTFVYVDEAQEYFDDTVETILSQARKYRLSITLAHQTLAQLAPRLKAAFLSNTSFKCVGGVSAGDARALASELHTTADFIESMRRRRDRTEFAVWLKHRTPEALRLTVPLGFLERQPTLSEEEYDQLLAANRARYSGSPENVTTQIAIAAPPQPASFRPAMPPDEETVERLAEVGAGARSLDAHRAPPAEPQRRSPRAPIETRELGKGGSKHRYLQSLVKELAEQQDFRATIEAPIPGGLGQIDVLLEQGDIKAAIEVSVTTPAEYERQNVRKCLDAGYGRVALVLAKSRSTQGRYQAEVIEGLSEEERSRVSFLSPEDIPDYIASLAPVPDPSERTIKGYKVRVSRTAISPEDARSRRDRLAKLIARSIDQQKS